MIQPVSIEIECFRGWKQREEFSLEKPITAIFGDNGCGKSSTTNAIEWCLFGSQVAQKGAGIDERQDWEIRPRGGHHQPTVVRLKVEVNGGSVQIERRREANAKKRDSDALFVQLADGTVHNDASAEAWLREVGFPDWETYRRAHCFHQEAARARVLNQADRTGILAALLGLEDDLELRDQLESQKSAQLIKEVDKILADLEGSCHLALTRPLEELRDAEKDLESKGITRHELGDTKASEVRRNMLNSATSLAERLQLDVSLPSVDDGPAFMLWAKSWPRQARSPSPALEKLDAIRQERDNLASAGSKAVAADEPWKTASKELNDATASGGDKARRDSAFQAASEKHQEAEAQLRQANERVALLTQAEQFLQACADKGECPVCGSEVNDLIGRLQQTIADASSEEIGKLQEAVSRAKEQLEQAKSAVIEFEQLIKEEERTAEQRLKAHAALRGLMQIDESAAVHDVVAKANQRIEELDGEIKTLEEIQQSRDDVLNSYVENRELLEQLEKWARLNERAQSEVDVESLPSWKVLNQAVDATADLACDLEALAELAREAQEERSKERQTAVNKRLGKYYRQIVGDSTATDIRVTTKRTAKKLSYDLVDGSNQPALPVLNQAAMNALSLAMLFAQAEDQASKGGLSWVVLDDPVQSLDTDRQAGLISAVESIAQTCRVLLATVPGMIESRIQNFVSTEKCIVTLAPYSPDAGAAVAERRFV